MIQISQITKPIDKDLEDFNALLKELSKSHVNIINVVINYILKNKGKQLRPIICLLSSRLLSKPNESTIIAASLIEMIHVATLVHDDIVDDSSLRRGWPSVKSVWKNKISLLIGDYIFSKALSSMIKLENFDALKVLSNTANRLSEGELLQMEHGKAKEMDESIYIKMVSDKTASLFAASSEIGSITAGANTQQREALKKYGEKLGIAFQIKDDLFDVIGTQEGVGKPTSFDVKKNILTLPFIHFMSSLNIIEKAMYKTKLKFYSKRKETKKIKNLIINSGSLKYAEQVMEKFSNEAIQQLDIFEDSDSKKSLILLVKYNLERCK